jgi:hypothetical protein
MKLMKLFGIIALVAVIEFSMTACGDGGNNTGTTDTYTTFAYDSINNSILATLLGTAVPTTKGEVVSTKKSRTDALDACNALSVSDPDLQKYNGVKYSEVETFITVGIENEIMGVISASDKTTMINKLKNDGWGMCAVGYGGGYNLLIAFF